MENNNFFNFNIKLNTIKLAEVKYNVPNNPGIYVIYESGKMIKIGQTVHLRNRLQGYYLCKSNDCEFSRYITYLNRDNMIIQWKEYGKESISDIETLMVKVANANNIDLLCWKRK
ncbi:hypothetical protein NNC19_10880 [Clostridium sp. SHJSY1]|uniref:hypothetical protein n=1 Tax=Clostridium sp. SHJSY1 TaxID=2942483 RepID=UPI0028749828|nr:hypothetical protein [Clostridium sp. SHJSY1]MDS0526185.1 hypothetical protein [Clostridium sp. SHJSY1]